jgi:hypothetical protein
MIKTVGILTFHRVLNYGAVLQGYALQRTLDKLGVSSVFVDLQLPNDPFYEPSAINAAWQERCKSNRPQKNTSCKRIFKSAVIKTSACLLTAHSRKRFRAFQDNFLKLTHAPFANPEALYENPPALDAFITGSDQVWNPEIGARWSPEPFFLTFAPEGVPRIAYAPSFGVEYIGARVQDQYREWLNAMTHLSAREAQGAKIIEDICGRTSKVVLDPTLLLTSNEWQDISKPPNVSKPYIFCYSVGSDDDLMKICAQLKKQTGWPVFKIGRSIRVILDILDNNVQTVISAGPQEFLGYLQNASLIVTNSFHGTALSINMQKPFFFVPTDNHGALSRMSRIDNLLNQLHLEGQVLAEPANRRKSLFEINYLDAASILEEKKTESLNYLRSALRNL